MKTYVVKYRESYVGAEGWMKAGSIRYFRCNAKSKAKAVMLAVNLYVVHRVISVERVKE